LFERGEAGAILARFHFGDERCLAGAERVDVDVMSATAKASGPGQWIAFGLNAECSVQGDDLALNAIALATVTPIQFALLFVGSFVWFL
jgi:hypothetical protein